MFARNSVASLLIVVGFLVLTAIASVLYGSDSQKKEGIQSNPFWQQTRAMADWSVAYLTGANDHPANQDQSANDQAANDSGAVDTGKLQATGQAIAQQVVSGVGGLASSSSPASDSATSSASLKVVVSDLQAAWDKANSSSTPEVTTDSSWHNFVSWEQSATGADLIFRSKNGESYIIPFPLKFLGK
jgi:hypothetical protein